MGKRKKTIKELNFLRNLFKTGNKRKSAKKSYNIGSQTKGKRTKAKSNSVADNIGQKVAARLQDDIDTYYKEQKIDIHWVLKRLVNKADFSNKEVIQIKALELIGKNKKMFVDKIEFKEEIDNEKIHDLAEKIIKERMAKRGNRNKTKSK